MKKYYLLFISLFVIACQDPHSPLEPNLGEEFQLKFGQNTSIAGDDLIIRFKDLLEDSRCPKGVACFWAGNAKIAVQLNDSVINLNTYLEPKKVTTSQYSISLVALDPYPVHHLKFPEESYKARLLVTRN